MDTMDVRRQEDIHAAEALGAAVIHLNLLECIYRKKIKTAALSTASCRICSWRKWGLNMR
ncbi:hypothetical protein ACFTAO_23490 [Paenibacillus rhizoplanae]